MSQFMTPYNISTAITISGDLMSAGFQSFNERIGTGTLKTIIQVLVAGPTLDSLVNVVEISDEVIKIAVSQWREHKSEKFTGPVVKDFLEYTSDILGLCSELNVFLTAARDRHSKIEYMASLWKNNMIDDMKSEDFEKFFEDLKILRDSEAYDMSCKNLIFTKVGRFMSQQQNMFTRLIRETQLQKGERKTDSRGWWHYVLRGMITMGCLVGILVLSIGRLDSNEIPQTIADAVVNAGKMAQEGVAWCTSLSVGVGKHLPSTRPELIVTKEKILIITELQEIDLLVNVMAAEIDANHAILSNVNYANNRRNVGIAMKDMSVKADKFLKKIEELKGKLEQCISNITEARKEVKSGTQSKIKRNCSIM